MGRFYMYYFNVINNLQHLPLAMNNDLLLDSSTEAILLR